LVPKPTTFARWDFRGRDGIRPGDSGWYGSNDVYFRPSDEQQPGDNSR
jgi:hypothetical protein